MTWTIIVGLFCYFLFMWLFRLAFMVIILKVIGQMVEEKTKAVKDAVTGKKG